MEQSKEARSLTFFGGELISFLPILTYISIAMIFALGFNSLSMQSVTVGGMIGIFITFLLSKDKDIFWKTIVSGVTKTSNANLIFSFLLIGLFTTILTSGQIGEGLVWISQVLHLNGAGFVVFAFLASAVIAVGSGAPIAAIFAIVPILYPPSVILGANPAVLLGAIISGILFGDNLAPSAQGTLAAASSQTFKATGEPVNPVTVIADRAKYIVVVAVLSAVLFFMNGNGIGVSQGSVSIDELSNPMGLLMLIPLAALLLVCIKTKNLFKGLSVGILLGFAVGLVSGLFTFIDIVSVGGGGIDGILINGIYSMIDVVVSTLFLFGMIEVMLQGGDIQKLSNWFTTFSLVKKPFGAELVIAAFAVGINILLAGCPLPAILVVGSFVNDLGRKANLHPSRRSYFMMGMTHTISVIVPFSSVYIMSQMTMVQNLNAQYQLGDIAISPFNVFANTYFALIMTVVAALWLFAGIGRKLEKDIDVPSSQLEQTEKVENF